MGEVVAGRRLDVIVAEQVMGWQRWSCEDYAFGRSVLQRPEARLGASWRVVEKDVPLTNGGDGSVPRFSTDLTAAWTVVEKLRAEHIDVMLFQSDRNRMPPELIEPEDRQWQCALWWQENGEHRETTQYADTPTEAICRAALRALSRPPGAAASGMPQDARGLDSGRVEAE